MSDNWAIRELRDSEGRVFAHPGHEIVAVWDGGERLRLFLGIFDARGLLYSVDCEEDMQASVELDMSAILRECVRSDRPNRVFEFVEEIWTHLNQQVTRESGPHKLNSLKLEKL